MGAEFCTMSEKIKELYDCEYVTSDEALYPLQEWYNTLIDKTMDDITIADVLRMIRQKMFIKLAMQKAVEILQRNVFAGELYDGQLIDKISEIDSEFFEIDTEKLKLVVKDALDKSEAYEWSYDGEKEEFIEIVKLLAKKIA